MMSTFVVTNVSANGLGSFKSVAMIKVPEPNRNDTLIHLVSERQFEEKLVESDYLKSD